jgi:hypothetical protein
VNFFAAAYVGKEKAPYYSKIIRQYMGISAVRLCTRGGRRYRAKMVSEEHVKLNYEQVSAWSRVITKGKVILAVP